MRAVQCLLILAVVCGTSLAIAQEEDKPKDKPLPWWKLSGKPGEKEEPQAKPDGPNRRDLEPLRKDEPRGELPRLNQARGNMPGAKGEPNAKPDTSDWQVAEPVKRDVHQGPASGYGWLTPPRSGANVTPSVSHAAQPEPRQRLVHRLANMPAADVARTVNELLRSEQPPSQAGGNMVVLADAVSNSLILSGTPDEVQETVKLVEQLDIEPLMVCVQAVIGLVESREGLSLLAPNPEGPELSCSHAEACELIEQFSKSDAVKILARPQILTLDNQPAFLQIGHRVPRITTTKDGQVLATELENVGLILGITPRVSPDHAVTMEIDIEKSEVGPEEQGIPLGVDAKGNVIRCPKIETAVAQTTVSIPPGRAMIVAGLALDGGEKRGELVLVITPHIVAKDE